MSNTSLTSNNSSNNANHLQMVELESHIILRMPVLKDDSQTKAPPRLHPATQSLREALTAAKLESANEQPGEDLLRDRLSIELNVDTRRGRVKFDNETFEARLVDLPCTIESLKTTDRKSFYKIADVSQMLVCRAPTDEPWSDAETQSKTTVKDSNPKVKYQWPHGITEPLKNVRKRRFRKSAKKKLIDYEEIVKEVKQLFRADRDAVKIEYEVVYVDADQDEENEDLTLSEEMGGRRRDFDLDENDDDDLDMEDENDEDSRFDSASKLTTKRIVKRRSSGSMKARNVSFMDEDSNFSMAGGQLGGGGSAGGLAGDEANDSMSIPTTSKAKSHTETTFDDDEDPDNYFTRKETSDAKGFNESSSNADFNKASSSKTKSNDEIQQVFGDLSSSEEEIENFDEVDEPEDIFPSFSVSDNKIEPTSSFKFSSLTEKNKSSKHTSNEATSGKTSIFKDINDESSSVSIFGVLDEDEGTSSQGQQSKAAIIDSLFPGMNMLDQDENGEYYDEIFNNEPAKNLKEEAAAIEDSEEKAILGGISVLENMSLSSSFSLSPPRIRDPTVDDPPQSNKATEESELEYEKKEAEKLEMLTKLATLETELEQMAEDRQKREKDLSLTSNPVLKNVFSSRLQVFIADIERKIVERDELKLLLDL